jgi:hypothetical protein
VPEDEDEVLLESVVRIVVEVPFVTLNIRV